jgi:hypothetical protein
MVDFEPDRGSSAILNRFRRAPVERFMSQGRANAHVVKPQSAVQNDQ